ncbi:hypothetical protein JM18_006406 [Phytophthora kernoviae]|uniref:Putative auto-transporter adhesin head GIN domain-containing protein n=2 Tax=Phytophthora kernoviae TaxID=325452 RepID=A0A921SEA8_9STRA|nr:hypothetical protein G195_007893 [Phytophthora kernoviae 00238/432]KAG2521861.1 hypothetical protein JM18_006406 [Phytophthora kernoviae]
MTGGARFLNAAMDGEDGNDNVQGKWIGLGIVITSAVLSNLGVNVQKLSHVRILTRTDVLGTLLIIIGVVLSTVANEPDQQMSLIELEKQFFQLGFLIYLGVMTAVLGGIFGQVEAILRLPRAMNEAKYRLLPFMYATASGIFGSFSVLLAKCASILLILTVGGENQFVYFTTYLFMGGMMCTLVLQTDLLNRAIMVGDTLSVFPMFQCFWIGSSVVGGVVFYEKYTRFSLFDWICLPIALSFIIAGIYLLAKHGEDDLDNPEDVENPTPGHRAHLTGHFGALMPLSPQGHTYRGFSRKSFDDRDNEHTPLRYTPKNGHGRSALLALNRSSIQSQQRPMSFKVRVGAIETPKNPIADRQRVQQTWAISGTDTLEKLHVAVPGLTYISVAPSEFFDEVAQVQGSNSDQLVAFAQISSDATDLLKRVDVIPRGSNRLLIGFDPRPPRGWPIEKPTEPGKNLLTEIFVREASELHNLEVFGGGDLVVADTEEQGSVLVNDRPYRHIKLAALRGSRLFVPQQQALRVGGVNLLTDLGGQLSLSTPELFAKNRIRIATADRWSDSRVIVQTPKLSTPSLQIAVAGSGNVRFVSNSQEAESSCDSQSLAIAGSGTIDTGDLSSHSARVAIFGSGCATLQASESLTVGSFGSARVSYLKPEPKRVRGSSKALRALTEAVKAQREQERERIAATVVPPTRESAFEGTNGDLNRWWWAPWSAHHCHGFHRRHMRHHKNWRGDEYSY